MVRTRPRSKSVRTRVREKLEQIKIKSIAIRTLERPHNVSATSHVAIRGGKNE